MRYIFGSSDIKPCYLNRLVFKTRYFQVPLFSFVGVADGRFLVRVENDLTGGKFLEQVFAVLFGVLSDVLCHFVVLLVLGKRSFRRYAVFQ